MYQRIISPLLKKSLENYDVLSIIGPRQSGKTTLAKSLFSNFSYVSLEDPDKREAYNADPRGFLSQLGKRVVIDEVQRIPEITSYIQGIIDSHSGEYKFVLTGSNGSMLMNSLTQSLAGRTDVFELLPLSYEEINLKNPGQDLNDYLFKGGYPRIYNESLDPRRWLMNYFRLYVEKDIRQIINITNLDLFERFVKLCAGRAGQLLNLSSLSAEVGVSASTIGQWISALKSTYICFKLNPHFKNFNKRIVKTPKLYFYDTGLLCYLLGIQSKEQLNIHPLRGQIFENFIISEHIKKKYNSGEEINYYFWRDQKGHEIDLIEDCSSFLFPIEIKMSQTFDNSFLKNILFFNQLQQNAFTSDQSIFGKLIYTGQDMGIINFIKVQNWTNVTKA